MDKVRPEFKPDVVLVTWRTLIANIGKMNHKELIAAITVEEQGANRKDVLLRLRRRVITLRAEQELEKLG